MWTRLVVRARHVAGRGAPCRSAPAVRPASVPCGRALHLARSDAATQAARDAGVSAAVEQDHNTLQSILDVPKAGVGQRSGAPTGLFAIDTLRTPADFMLLAEKTLERTQVLVHRISVAGLQANAHEELVSVVRNLDRLSDMLCGVIDMAELVRHAHPEPAWAEAANSAYEYLCNFMNVLNTHTGLYDALRRVMSEPSVWTQLSEEAQAVALIFLRDFEKSGIQLPPHERERFVQLSDEIMVLGRAFLQDMAHGAQEQVTVFPPELLHGLDVTPITGGTTWRGAARPVLVAPGSYELHYISKNAPDARARKLAYEIAHTGRHAPVQVLEKLLRARHDLATLTGQPSFAHMALIDKMAGTPAHVQQFLSQAAAAARPPAEQMIAALGELKSAAEGTAEVQVWDREYYVQQYLAQHEPARLLPLSPYLSLGSVFTGLSRLFALLYGIHFRAATPRPGEVWADDVVKLEVVDETEGGVIGTIYCDLYSRAGKPPSAAHYTVRCSRRLDWDDVERDVDLGGGRPGMDLSPLLGVTGETRRGRPGRFQLPVVVLMTDFTAPGSARGASLLRWQDVETLFHEMGHAIHSMIGRTEYHNVAGTRCATDFVELPSILMEHFVSAPSVVKLLAYHHQSGAQLPYRLLEQHLQAQRRLDALEAHQQILLATLDQWYHSERAGDADFDSSQVLEQLQKHHGLFPPVAHATWQGQFGHLFGYGATYYSYLFDRAIAARVWDQVFAREPLSREAGERFKDVLRHGGGRGPWRMLADLLNDEGLARGDTQAMDTVGRWGLGHAQPSADTAKL